MKSSHNKQNKEDRYQDNLPNGYFGFTLARPREHYKAQMLQGFIMPTSQAQCRFFIKNDVRLAVTDKIKKIVVERFVEENGGGDLNWAYSSSGRTAYYDQYVFMAAMKFHLAKLINRGEE